MKKNIAIMLLILTLVVVFSLNAQRDTSNPKMTIIYPEEFIDTLLPNKKYTFEYFLKDDTSMTNIMKDFCRQMVKYVQTCPKCTIFVQTHSEAKKTDSMAYLYSDIRLSIIKQYLHVNGIDTTKLLWRSMGALMPIRPNADPKSRARNRRVDFKIVKPL
ncbi:MAG: hypothetical protein NT007_12705 [Candidatus Kapabacteria bacterium]|nr:hypothetical protein [Candidatus Kapabacteria bacterium]